MHIPNLKFILLPPNPQLQIRIPTSFEKELTYKNFPRNKKQLLKNISDSNYLQSRLQIPFSFNTPPPPHPIHCKRMQATDYSLSRPNSSSLWLTGHHCKQPQPPTSTRDAQMQWHVFLHSFLWNSTLLCQRAHAPFSPNLTSFHSFFCLSFPFKSIYTKLISKSTLFLSLNTKNSSVLINWRIFGFRLRMPIFSALLFSSQFSRICLKTLAFFLEHGEFSSWPFMSHLVSLETFTITIHLFRILYGV